MRRLIVMRPGALGDALLALPALAALRATWPNAHITFIAGADVLPLVAANGLADAVYAYDLPAWSALWSETPRPDALLQTTFADADALVAWIRDAEGTVERNARALGIGRVVIAPGRPPDGVREHAAVYLLRTLAPLGMRRLPPTVGALAATMPPLHVPDEASDAASMRWDELGLHGQRVVALHPGSGGRQKCWPPEHFAALITTLRTHDCLPLVLEGPADGPVVRALCEALPAGAAPPVLRDAPLEELAALITRCAAYVGNDSGVTHLAALLGVPTLALFGPSDPAIWAPIGRRVHVLRADEGEMAAMDALPVGRVASELARMVG